MSDVLTAVKILAGSTVEIAAASVGEKSLVNAVQHIQENGKELDSTVEVIRAEILEAAADLVSEETSVAVNEEDLKSAEADAADEAADAKDSEELIAEETSAPAVAEEEEAATSSPEEASARNAEEVETEDRAAPKDDISPTEASPEDASPTEEADTSTAEASADDDTSPGEMTPAAETSAEEAAAETSGEDVVEAAFTHSEGVAVVDMTQLAAASAASELEAPVHEAKHCHSCPSAPPAAEEVVPPTAVGGKLVSMGAVNLTHGAKEVEVVEVRKFV